MCRPPQLECLVREAAMRVVELQGQGAEAAEEISKGQQRKAELEASELIARGRVQVWMRLCLGSMIVGRVQCRRKGHVSEGHGHQITCLKF